MAVIAASAALAGGHGLDTTSAEYADGWNSARYLPDPNVLGFNLEDDVQACLGALTPGKTLDVSFFQHDTEYDTHQRQEWAHGCLDELRQNTTVKIPAQSWE